MRWVTAGGTALAMMAAPMMGNAQPVAVSAVSMMTYNVKGLPWPLASGRPEALAAIGRQLLAMRQAGRQPHIVALQEAFVPEAKAIGRAAGYRYVAYGPGTDDAAPAATAEDARFAADGSYLRGEGLGKQADSGLAIFSDYPIVAVRRVVYPVCAGYDCLANKGAMAALVAVPGASAPVAVIDTHLNAGAASGVARSRSLYAYRRQLDTLAAFLTQVAPTGTPVLVAGDFNTGRNPARRGYFDSRMLASLSSATRLCATPAHCVAGVGESIRHGKDWLMFRSSGAVSVAATDLAAPFGRDASGAMLSDHIGVTATYRLASGRPADAPVRLASR